MRFLLVLICLAWSGASHAESVACRDVPTCGNFDIVVVAGQSNATSRGLLSGHLQHRDNSGIFQLGRFGPDNRVVIPAAEPLQHVTGSSFGVGFAMTFARLYRDIFLLPGRKVLIIPAANGGQSVTQHGYWRPTGPGYSDAVLRTLAAKALPNSRVVAILWHQGESDVNATSEEYRRDLKSLLMNMRTRVNPGAPIIMGELPPDLSEIRPEYNRVNRDIHAVSDMLPRSGVVPSAGLPSVGDNPFTEDPDYFHFNGKSQARLGVRYFALYEALLN